MVLRLRSVPRRQHTIQSISRGVCLSSQLRPCAFTCRGRLAHAASWSIRSWPQTAGIPPAEAPEQPPGHWGLCLAALHAAQTRQGRRRPTSQQHRVACSPRAPPAPRRSAPAQSAAAPPIGRHSAGRQVAASSSADRRAGRRAWQQPALPRPAAQPWIPAKRQSCGPQQQRALTGPSNINMSSASA